MKGEAAKLRRRWLYLPFAIAGVIMAGYFLLWRAGAAEMKKAVVAWVEDQRAAGLVVSHGALEAEGFPFFLRLHIADPDIAALGAWRWRTERLTLDALPYDLNRLIFSVRSEQFVSAAGYGDWRLNADDFRASIANDKTRDWVFSVTLGDGKAERFDAPGEAGLKNLVFDLSPDAADKTSLVLSLEGDGINATVDDHAVALDRIQTVTIATQTHAMGDAATWRNAGGALVINGFYAQLEEAKLAMSGELMLDSQLYPTGNLDTEIIAPAPFAHALAQAGVMSSGDADSAAAALTLAAIAGGGKLSAPIEFKDGAAQIANVRLIEFAATP